MDWTALVAFWGVPSAVTAFCFWLLQRNIRRRDKTLEEKDAAREQNQIFLIKGMGASMALSEAIAMAVRDGKCNGEIDAALKYAQEVKHEQRDFLTEQGVKHLF